MIEFVTKETHKCPYCNSILLETSSFDGKEIWKICTVCNKRFEIAWMFPTEWQQDFEKIRHS